MGEARDDEFIGLHNWIQFYLQEKAGNIDYFGHFRRETVSCCVLLCCCFMSMVNS